MNQKMQKKLDEADELLNKANDLIAEVKEECDEKVDNENFRDEDAKEAYSNASSNLESCQDNILEALENLHEAQSD